MVISGGVDHQLGAIFVHKLNPSGPAALAGLLPGDRLLSVNQSPLSGLTHQQALQVLKDAQSPLQVETQRVEPEQWHRLMDDALALHRATPLTTPKQAIPSNLEVPAGCKYVELTKGARGFGFSIQGGKDKSPPEPITVRGVIPDGPAGQDGRMGVDDVVLVANNHSLADATFEEALTTLKGLPTTATFCLLPKAASVLEANPVVEEATPPLPPTPDHKPLIQMPPPPSEPSSPVLTKQAAVESGVPAAVHVHPEATDYYAPLVGDPFNVSIKSKSTFGFAMSGGVESQRPLFVKKVSTMTPAALAGIAKYDVVTAINGVDVKQMTLPEALTVIKAANGQLDVELLRPDLPSRQLLKRAKDVPSRQSSITSTASDLPRPVPTKVAVPKAAPSRSPERRDSLDERKFQERLDQIRSRSDDEGVAAGAFLSPAEEMDDEEGPAGTDFLLDQPFAHTKRYTVAIDKGSRTLGLKFKGSHLPNGGASLKVQQVMPGGAAAQDGTIQPGDVLMALDDCPVYGKPESDVYASLRGTAGKVVMQFARDGQLVPSEAAEVIAVAQRAESEQPAEVEQPTKATRAAPTIQADLVEAAPSAAEHSHETSMSSAPTSPMLIQTRQSEAMLQDDDDDEEDMDGDLPELPSQSPPSALQAPVQERELEVEVEIETKVPEPETVASPVEAVMEAPTSPLNLEEDSVSLSISLAPELPSTLPPGTPVLDDGDSDELDLDDLDDLDLGDGDEPPSPGIKPPAASLASKPYTKITPSKTKSLASLPVPDTPVNPLDQSLITSSAAVANDDVYDHVRSRRVDQLPREEFDATQKRKWQQIREAVQACLLDDVPASEYVELRGASYEVGLVACTCVWRCLINLLYRTPLLLEANLSIAS
jgi:C-terminal processing protease CtpA/Prc